MLVLNRIYGNTTSDQIVEYEVQRREKLGEVEHLAIAFADAGRRRLRATSSASTEVGIDLDSEVLKDGDVLVPGDDTSRLFLVDVAPSEAMALRMGKTLPPEELFAFGVRLGHMLGNQHWPIKVENDVVLTPVNIDRLVMETVVRTHGFDGIEWEFVPVQPGDLPTGMPALEHELHVHE